MLIQLLPSSTVAAGVRWKIGFGTVASAMPGGTCQPDPPNSGGMREPLQYWLATARLDAELTRQPGPPPGKPRMFARHQAFGVSLAVDAWLVGPVRPRTPMFPELAGGHGPGAG